MVWKNYYYSLFRTDVLPSINVVLAVGWMYIPAAPIPYALRGVSRFKRQLADTLTNKLFPGRSEEYGTSK
jgi:hypothetical protein